MRIEPPENIQEQNAPTPVQESGSVDSFIADQVTTNEEQPQECDIQPSHTSPNAESCAKTANISVQLSLKKISKKSIKQQSLFESRSEQSESITEQTHQSASLNTAYETADNKCHTIASSSFGLADVKLFIEESLQRFLGFEEPSLAAFVLESYKNASMQKSELVQNLQTVLDDDAARFVDELFSNFPRDPA